MNVKKDICSEPSLDIASEMLRVMRISAQELRDEIKNVCHAGFDDGCELIMFELRGNKYIGKLIGRNRDLCLGFGDDSDKGIACRVLLDGDVKLVHSEG